MDTEKLHELWDVVNPKYTKKRIVHHRQEGYWYVGNPNHPHATQRGYIKEHRAIAEQALGKVLPPKIVVHHVNGNRGDNRKTNLVVCENEYYHNILHQRTKALRECGHASWRKCSYCQTYSPPDEMYIAKNHCYHRACRAEDVKRKRRAKKEIMNSRP